jgi:hypothetical protein
MARLLSIVKRSSVDLQLFKTSDGDKLLKTLQAVSDLLMILLTPMRCPLFATCPPTFVY